jgi:serine/threonine-protein kinase
MMSAARSVIDAAGPLADTATPRPVPAFGDHFDVPTTTGGRSVPPEGDRSSLATNVGGVSGVSEHIEAARRPRVLLAGLEANTRAVTRVAAGDRIDVEEAPPGESLLDTVRDSRPDLVILGWNAAGQPAREVVAALRADAVTRDSKVLLLVEHKQMASGDVVAVGADDRLAAPFSPLQLQVKLRKLLGADAVTG